MDSRKVSCLITGQSLIMGKDYFEKKCTEYGSVENLKQFYISSKAKKLLQRGYSVEEIRKILNIDSSSLEDANCVKIKELIEYHKVVPNNYNRQLESSLNFSMQNSDEDVVRFINNIKL